MRTVPLLLALATCPVPHSADGQGPPSGAEGPSSVPDASAHEDASTSQGGVPAEESWTIEGSRTEVWIVAGGSCVPLSFHPKDTSSGAVFVRAMRITYQRQGDQLELGPSASRSEGGGIVSRRCRTQLRIGPGRTLGGATLFHDEAACVAGQADAAPLDESAEATAARCRGEPVAVLTDEVECGVGDRYAIVAGRPGCISATLAGP